MVNHDAIAALEALFQLEDTPETSKPQPAMNSPLHRCPKASPLYDDVIIALDEALSQWVSPQSQQNVLACLLRHNEAIATQHDYASYAVQALFHTVYGHATLANRYIYKALNSTLHAQHSYRWMVHLALAHQQVFHGVFEEGHRLAQATLPSIPRQYRHLRHHALNLQSLALGLKQRDNTLLNVLRKTVIALKQWGITLGLHDVFRWRKVAQTLFALCKLAILEMRRMPYAVVEAQCTHITQQAYLTSITLHAAQLDVAQLAWAKALKRIKRAIRRMPSQPMLWLELARVYRLVGHTPHVVRCLEQAVSLMPTLVVAQVELGILLAERGCIVEAVERFALAYMHSGVPSQKRRLAYIMADVLERHGQRYPDTTGHIAWPELGAQMAILNKLDQEAATPTAATLSHLAKLANTLNQKELAVLACELALEHIKVPNAQCYINLAYSAWQAGLIEMAVYHYHNALRLDDSNALAHNNLGSIYLDHVHNLEAASTHFQRALEHNSGFALAHFNMGRLNTRLHYYAEAAHSFACAKAANRLTHELTVEEIDHHLHLLFDRM